MPSIYDPMWQRLKEKKFIKCQLELSEDSTPEDIAAQIKRTRKAISDLKLRDAEFRAKHPEARIEVPIRDSTNGVLALRLVYSHLPVILDI